MLPLCEHLHRAITNELANSPAQYAIEARDDDAGNQPEDGFIRLLIRPVGRRRKRHTMPATMASSAEAKNPFQIARREPAYPYTSVKTSPKMYVEGKALSAAEPERSEATNFGATMFESAESATNADDEHVVVAKLRRIVVQQPTAGFSSGIGARSRQRMPGNVPNSSMRHAHD